MAQTHSGDNLEILVMGSSNDIGWYDRFRYRVRQLFRLPDGADEDIGVGAAIIGERGRYDAAVSALHDAGAVRPDEAPEPENVMYKPPPVPEDAPPRTVGQISDGTSMMYVQTCFWVASYVKLRAERGDFTEDQLIEQFGVNVRRCIDPDWKASG